MDGTPICRRCGQPILPDRFAFGSDETGWEHMDGECPKPEGTADAD
jgi:hypothetical protein